MDQLIGEARVQRFSCEELASECGSVSDKLNNPPTAIQIKAGLLLEQAQSITEREGLRLILEASSEAAAHSERLRQLSNVTGTSRY